jgi:hypothetical protein
VGIARGGSGLEMDMEGRRSEIKPASQPGSWRLLPAGCDTFSMSSLFLYDSVRTSRRIHADSSMHLNFGELFNPLDRRCCT